MARNAASNVGKAASNTTGFFGEVFTRFWAVILVILIVFIALVIYYKTVGYYLDMGWKRLWDVVIGGGSVKMDMGPEDADGDTTPVVEASLKPMDLPTPPPMPSARSSCSISSQATLSSPSTRIRSKPTTRSNTSKARKKCGKISRG